MSGARILVVGGERKQACEALAQALAERAFEVAICGYDVSAGVANFAPDAAIVAVDSPDEARASIEELRGSSGVAVVALFDRETLAAAAETMRSGADALAVAPLAPAQAEAIVEKALEARRLHALATTLRERARQRCTIVGTAPELESAQEVIRRAAPTKATVLVVGEVGTGRELAAQAIHESSPRRDGPFLRVSCAGPSEALLESELFGHEPGSLPDSERRRDGRLERADGGTLYLQEVEALPPSLQVKLLRVLQQGEFERLGGGETVRSDIRVVASSSCDLAGEVRAGRFRDDLYYRLNVVSVTLPPLRQRKGDIPALVQHFLALASRERGRDVPGITPGALSALFAYSWPGNVRELRQAIERAVAACPGREIAVEHLPLVVHGGPTDGRGASALIPGAMLFEIEREAILRTLDDVGGSTVRAAEVLGISLRKIQYRLKEYRSGRPARPGRPGNVVPMSRAVGG